MWDQMMNDATKKGGDGGDDEDDGDESSDDGEKSPTNHLNLNK